MQAPFHLKLQLVEVRFWQKQQTVFLGKSNRAKLGSCLAFPIELGTRYSSAANAMHYNDISMTLSF